MDRKNIFLLLLVLGTAFWGISFSITKIAIGENSASTFLFYRFSLATIVLSVIFNRYLRNLDWLSIKIGAGLAIPLVFGIYMQTLGIKHSSASQCSFIAGTCVVIIPVLKLVLYRTFVSQKLWIAAFVSLIGLFIISIKNNFTIGLGDLYTLVGAFGFAVYLICVERCSVKNKLISTIVPMFAMCALLTFVIAIIDANAKWQPITTGFWWGIVFCSLFSTAYMYTVSNISQRYISAERVALIYLFEPIFGAVAAFFIMDESITYRLLIGGGLIFCATLISELNVSSNNLLEWIKERL
ncbi:DMT family transporter [Chryseobacterium sp. HR92]|uniref:DMT family transporter n=1 Tax=Chryseobacterium sp. HR92 TaxID=3094839 RepID=UPI00388CFCA2|nr:DMT family transporter [Chryseobacterium sp. HR92]